MRPRINPDERPRLMIYVGTCGYAYKDWIGPFYPPRTRNEEMLAFYARTFPAVEIDTSYYGVPTMGTVASMNARTPKAFRLSFKAPKTVTHGNALHAVHDDAKKLREAIEPLHAVSKLACVLAQFPNGFHPNRANDAYLRRIAEAFEGLPLVVEFRHRDWQQPETFELLSELGIGICNVDLPDLEGLPHASSDVSSGIGYVRLHGRNAAQWWSGTNVTRYAYDYTPADLVPWIDRIAEMAGASEATYVFFNNHARGSATRNAEMLEALLEERFGADAPGLLVHAAGGNPEQQRLFGVESEGQG